MLNKKYQSYDFDETESFVTIAEQKGFSFGDIKAVDIAPKDGVNGFYDQDGQDAVDLVQVEF